jgi:hypothetical protein
MEAIPAREARAMNSTWLRAWVPGALAVAAGAGLCPVACSSPAARETKTLTAQDLRDPTRCMGCHPTHYEDWSKSMHAYASDDPVFLAMNARGQRETNGKLGGFCVQCHAPVAMRDGLVHDGTPEQLAALPPAEKGVTCFFCHSVDSVGASHVNADVNLAADGVMRAAIKDPQDNSAHASAYSTLQDHTTNDSAAMCGTCHDIVAPAGGHIERTYHEWLNSIFAGNVTCGSNGNCHMAAATTTLQIAAGGPGNRTYHGHDFRAVDVAFNPGFPQAPEDQEAAITKALSQVLQGALCVNIRGGVRVFLDDATAAHSWPSGASQDRRAWVEVAASVGGAPPFYASGTVPAGTPVGAEANDPDLWVLRDQMFGTDGAPAHMFWQAACAAGNELTTAQDASQLNQNNFTHRYRLYPNKPSPDDSVLPQMPDKVTLTVHLQPIGLDVLQDLVDSHDLDQSVLAQMPTFDVALPTDPADGIGDGTTLVWTPGKATGGYMDLTQDQPTPMTCVSTAVFNLGATTYRAADPPATCPINTGDAGH